MTLHHNLPAAVFFPRLSLLLVTREHHLCALVSPANYCGHMLCLHPVHPWCAVALEASSAAGCDRRQNSDTFPTFTRRLLEIWQGRLCLWIAQLLPQHSGRLTWAATLCIPFTLPLLQYSIYITSTKSWRMVLPFINCSKAKQTGATHSSSRSWWFLIVSLICFTNTIF